jgi:HlyD family secretion protein
VFKKKITWIVIAILLIVVGVIIYFKNREGNPEYTTETVRRGNIIRTVSATGIFKSTQEVNLAFQVSGKVKKINAEVGDYVKKGEILAFLDQTEALSLLRQYQADLQVQEDALLLKRRNWDDLKPEERDSAKASVNKYKALIEGSRAKIRKNIIYASQDGIITKVDVEEGETVMANSPIITVIKEGEWEIEADVAESDITEVSLGQKVQLTFDALDSSEIFKGEVIKIDPASTLIQDVVYYKVKIKLEKKDKRLKRGMSVDADIITYRKDDVLLIPTRAIKKDGSKKYVEILEEKNKKKKAYIETGISGDEGETEIIKGLVADQEVITFSKN